MWPSWKDRFEACIEYAAVVMPLDVIYGIEESLSYSKNRFIGDSLRFARTDQGFTAMSKADYLCRHICGEIAERLKLDPQDCAVELRDLYETNSFGLYVAVGSYYKSFMSPVLFKVFVDGELENYRESFQKSIFLSYKK